MDWSAFVSAIVGGVVMLVGSMALERFRARTAAIYTLAQSKWELRRDTYVKLLTLLQQTKSESEMLALEAAHVGGEASQDGMRQVLELVRQLGPPRAALSLWADEPSLRALEVELSKLTPPDPHAAGAAFWRDTARACAEAGRLITEQARRELQLNLP
jgi:hypothetical protein